MFIGIDPGLSGAITELKNGIPFVLDMPTHTIKRGKTQKREIDHIELARLLDDLNKPNTPLLVVIEQSWARPGEGASGAFSFGRSFGIALGVAAAQFWRIELVPPQRWKKAIGVSADKDSARRRASELFPLCADTWARKKDDGRAESALIAEYARRIYQGENQKAVENGFDAGTKISS